MSARPVASWQLHEYACGRDASPDIWTISGFWITLAGLLVGVAALVVAIRIFRSTNRSDAEKHSELLDSLAATKDALQDAIARGGANPADLFAAGLSVAEAAFVDQMLEPAELAVHARRRSRGRGNHPWQVVTSRGRILEIYTGGRTGGVHGRVLDE